MLGDQQISGRSPRAINHMGLARSFQITNIFQNMSVFENMRCALLGPMGAGYSFLRPASSYRAITERAVFPGLTVEQNLLLGVHGAAREVWSLDEA
ncbi:MAG TPA: hypothetical protein VFD96_11535, partial [Burkholderiaceae bacterium]|nr:hypothetical protein [Burkholderiaceae bacterium]